MNRILTFVFILLICSAQELQQAAVNTQLNGTLNYKGSAYYFVTIPTTLQPNTVLIATVDVSEDHVAPEIFISATEQFPSYSSSDQLCLATKIGSCAVGNLTPSTPIYISVFCLDGCNYTLFVDLEPTRTIEINKRFNLSFDTSSSGILTFTFNQSYDQFNIMAQEQDFYASNHYRMLLGKGFIPSQNNNSFSCFDIGPYRKAIKLIGDDISINITYYLLIEAEANTSIYLNTQTYAAGEQGVIAPNSTIFDYLDSQQNYTLSYVLSNTSVQKPLYIRLKTYSGTGTIIVTHCEEHIFYYWNNDGENEEIRISPKERQDCLNSQQMLMIQNVQIRVVPFMSVFSFSIGNRESNLSSEVRFAEYQSGALGLGQYSNFTLSLLQTQPTNISLNIWMDEGSAAFILLQCVNDSTNCVTLGQINDEGNILVQYDPATCDGRCYLQLNIQGEQDETQFGFIYRANGFRMKLDEESVDIGFIAMNQYIYYNLTLSNPLNVESVTIKVVEYSGEVSLIGSQSVTNPHLQMEQTIMNWNNLITFTTNLSNPIYLSILGNQQSIYKLSVIVNRVENTPTKYVRLEDAVSNEFRTQGDPILVRYTPTVNPYYISFYPFTPSCISYGQTIPLNNTCMTLPQTFEGQLYMNITGVYGELVKLTVSTEVFELSSANPLFLDCEDGCAQLIIVNVLNQSVGVMHSGYGRISVKGSNTTVNNGLLNLTCPNEKTTCILTVLAELNWGEMIVSLASDDIFQVSWYPQPVSLKALPKKLVYKLPKNVPSVITIVSKIASLDLYANIQTLDLEHTNHVSLSYPNKTSYDFKVESDFFKRTLTLQITAALQKELGCFSENEFCVLTLTVYLNNHCRYVHLVDDSIFLVSASSYTTILQENTRYLMQDIAQLEYYEYQSTIPKNFTFMIEPISSCKPLLLYSNQTDYPTDQLHTHQSYHEISITNSTRAIVGVISESECLYNIMVSIDNVSSNYRVLIEGFAETINLPKNSTTYYYYETPNKIPFQISATVSNFPVYVLEVPSGEDPSLYLPKKGNSDYSSPHLPILVNNSKPTTYMIAIVNTFSTNITTSLLITQSGLQIIMTHNRIYKQSTEENKTYSFRYYSANSFMIDFVTSSGALNISVNASPDINLTMVLNDTSTESSLHVPSDGSLRPYWIEVQSSSIGYFSIEIIDVGSESSPTLSSGLPYFDAFTENPQTNCYQFKGDPTSSDPIRVSLMYSQEFIKSLAEQNATIKSLDLTFSYSFKPYEGTNESVILRNYLQFVQGITFSLEQKYGMYTFCFENTADQLVDQSYYVVLGSKDLQFLLPSLSFFVSDDGVQLDKYELIVTEDKTIVAEIMNCGGQTHLTGNSNYTDVLSGMTTEIHDQFRNGPYFAGVVNVSKGYYYLGAKAIQPNSTYIIRFTTHNQTSGIVLSEMVMGDINLKWYGSGDYLVVTIEPLKCAQSCNKTKYTRYYLYLGKNIMAIKRRTSCGIHDDGMNVQVYDAIRSDLNSTSPITFRILLQNIPDHFALSVRAEAVQITDQEDPRSVYYFYNTTKLLQASDIDFQDDWFSWEAMVLTMIIMGLVLLFFLLCIMKRYKVGPFRQREVEFEVQEFVENNSRDAEPSRNNNNEVELQEVQRRQVDDGVAYGEFIDESRI